MSEGLPSTSAFALMQPQQWQHAATFMSIWAAFV